MTFADLQVELGLVKQRRRPLDVVHARKKNYCLHCAKKGIVSKLELIKDGYTRMEYTRYKFEIWACHVCRNLDKRYVRIEGKGKSGVDSGKLYGIK